MTHDKRLALGVALNGYGLATREPGGLVRQVLPWRDLLDIVRTAEETGYGAVSTPETAAREAFSTLAGFAAATADIRLATGVVPTSSRDVRTTAMAAASVHDLSGGRFLLGVGSSEPVDATRRYLRMLRELLRGEEVVGHGPGPPLAVGPIDLVGPRGVDVPIYLAALGPRMTELAGEAADGVILNWCTPDRVSRAREQIASGAERGGRDPSAVTVAVYVRSCLGHDDEHAVAALKEAAGQYASMEKYRAPFEAMGLGVEAEAAASAFDRGRFEEVPDRLLHEVAVWGTREQARDRLRAYRDAGADLVVVYPVPAQDAVSSIMGTLLAAAPDPAVEH